MVAKAVVICPRCATPNRVEMNRTQGEQAKCAKCATPLGIKNGVINTSATGLERLVAGADLPVIVDFWAPWCGPCVGFAPVFERVASESLNQFLFVKIDTQAHPEAASAYQVRGIPTLVKIKGGREVARQAGAMPEPVFRQWLNAL